MFFDASDHDLIVDDFSKSPIDKYDEVTTCAWYVEHLSNYLHGNLSNKFWQIVPQWYLCYIKFKLQFDHNSQRSLWALRGRGITFSVTAGRMDVKDGAEAIGNEMQASGNGSKRARLEGVIFPFSIFWSLKLHSLKKINYDTNHIKITHGTRRHRRHRDDSATCAGGGVVHIP